MKEGNNQNFLKQGSKNTVASSSKMPESPPNPFRETYQATETTTEEFNIQDNELEDMTFVSEKIKPLSIKMYFNNKKDFSKILK